MKPDRSDLSERDKKDKLSVRTDVVFIRPDITEHDNRSTIEFDLSAMRSRSANWAIIQALHVQISSAIPNSVLISFSISPLTLRVSSIDIAEMNLFRLGVLTHPKAVSKSLLAPREGMEDRSVESEPEKEMKCEHLFLHSLACVSITLLRGLISCCCVVNSQNFFFRLSAHSANFFLLFGKAFTAIKATSSTCFFAFRNKPTDRRVGEKLAMSVESRMWVSYLPECRHNRTVSWKSSLDVANSSAVSFFLRVCFMS